MSEDITGLLMDWSQGDEEALDALMPLVYEELRKTARQHLLRERANHTLQPADVINEVYLRLTSWRKVDWLNRTQFFGFASKLMRRILVDHARARQTSKRGGQLTRITLSEALNVADREDLDPETILSLDAALSRLRTLDTRLSELIDLRFFAGLTVNEAAEMLGISKATLMRDWDHAKRWLARELDRR